jgi:hypothetical protein
MQEYVELLDGKQSDLFRYFKNLIVRGFFEIRKHVDSLIYLIKLMMKESDLPCFSEFDIGIFR